MTPPATTSDASPTSRPGTIPLIFPRGKFPVPPSEMLLPDRDPVPAAITSDGSDVEFHTVGVDDDSDCTPLLEIVVRPPAGEPIRTGATSGCPVGIDTNSVNRRWIAWIEATTAELEIAKGWELRVLDRETLTVRVLTEPDRARIPVEAISLEGDLIAWHEFDTPSDPTVETGWHSYIVDLVTGRRIDLGDGVVNPLIRAPYVYGTRVFTERAQPSRLLRFNLNDGSPSPWIDAEGAPLVATKDLVLALSDGRGVLIDTDGHRVAQFVGTLLYPVASDHLVTWAKAIDALTAQVQILDTRCLALYDVGDVEFQGVSGTVAGSYFRWIGRDGAEPLDSAAHEYGIDTATVALCP